jgi:hypothetical protein
MLNITVAADRAISLPRIINLAAAQAAVLVLPAVVITLVRRAAR